MAIVVDVSIAAAWCFPDEQADAAERALDELPRLGGVVPGDTSWRRPHRTGQGRVPLEDTHLARKHGLSAYDAAYLETALRRGDSLATLDRELANAAAAEGVTLIR